MPVVPAADPARTVIGPDDPAVARIISVGIVAAVEMPTMEVRDAIAPEMMEAAVPEAAAVPTATMPASATMKGVETATVEATTVEAATMKSTSAMETTATVAAASYLDHVSGPSLRR